VSTKSIALLGAALLILDFSATAVVSAAAAASYLAGEIFLPFPVYVVALFILVLLTFISLSGLREGARLAACVLSIHVSYPVSIAFLFLIPQGRGNDHACCGFGYCFGTRWCSSAQFQLVR